MLPHPENTTVTDFIQEVRKRVSKLTAGLVRVMMTIMVAIRLLTLLLQLDGAAERQVNE